MLKQQANSGNHRVFQELLTDHSAKLTLGYNRLYSIGTTLYLFWNLPQLLLEVNKHIAFHIVFRLHARDFMESPYASVTFQTPHPRMEPTLAQNKGSHPKGRRRDGQNASRTQPICCFYQSRLIIRDCFLTKAEAHRLMKLRPLHSTQRPQLSTAQT